MKRLTWLVVACGVAWTAIKRFRQESRPSWPCALHGHTDTLIFGEAGRVFLRCANCQQETPGWDLIRGKVEA